jgi:hypothetical protein
MIVFRDIEPCILVVVDRRFRHVYWLLHEDDEYYIHIKYCDLALKDPSPDIFYLM